MKSWTPVTHPHVDPNLNDFLLCLHCICMTSMSVLNPVKSISVLGSLAIVSSDCFL